MADQAEMVKIRFRGPDPGDVETLWAYYAAVRRSADILRAVAVVDRGKE